MFFAPPEVKAISRYSDFGSHLGMKTFTVMLGIAILLHAGFFGAYAMMPRGKIIKVPVRVLNINLGPDATEAAPASEQPTAEQTQAPQPEIKNLAEEQGFQKKAPLVAMDKALAPKKVEDPKLASDKKAPPKIVAPTSPKKYVREAPADPSKPKTDAQAQVYAKPEEMVQRYTQTMSLWVRKRQVYPLEAKASNAQGSAIMRVRIDRQGNILYHVIEKSTGNAFLDHAAMKMVRESNPMPPLPDNYPEGEVFEFLVPVNFTLEKH